MKLKPAFAKWYLQQAGFTGDDLNIATAIAGAESGYDTEAKGGPNRNGTYDWGLMQINDLHKPSDDVKTKAAPNAAVAFALYKGAGNKFTAWSAYNNGKYKDYLSEASAAEPAAPPGGDSYGELSPPQSVDNPLTAIAQTLQRITSSILTVIVGLVLIILGIVILVRKDAVKVAGTAAKAAIL